MAEIDVQRRFAIGYKGKVVDGFTVLLHFLNFILDNLKNFLRFIVCRAVNLYLFGTSQLAIHTGIGTNLGGILLMPKLRPKRLDGTGP